MAKRSSTNSWRSGSPLIQWAFSDADMHLSRRLLLKVAQLVGWGTGTSRLRLMNPTLFPTLPFSLPEAGLQNEWAKPWWAANLPNSSVVRTRPQTLRPTPVALSNTMRVGTPPAYPNICLSAWHTHSAFSPGKTWARPTLEQGNAITKKLSRVRTPFT